METNNKFFWGVVTSAFQIEGFLQNDMTEWEAKGKFRTNDKNPVYGDASRHWKLWEEDFLLLKELGVNSYRYSMDWGRIEPEKGVFDEGALCQYDRMVDKLLELGITPMLTLHHFTHPVWFHKISPWHKKASVPAFLNYAEKIIDRFRDRISLFITFNEPMVWILAAYGDGKFPPGKKNVKQLGSALAHMLTAHGKIYDYIKSRQPEAQVGIAKNFIIFRPERSWSLLDRGVVHLIHKFYNMTLFDAFKSGRLKLFFPFLLNHEEKLPVADKIDFWGINYYYRLHIRFQPKINLPLQLNFIHRSGEGLSDLGWENYSDGLWEVMQWINLTGKPYYITENGIADASDEKRISYLQKHLAQVRKARENDFPLKGYFHWSLMDNYEWLEGESARFGLYAVDYSDNYSRILRGSGRYYSEFIKSDLL